MSEHATARHASGLSLYFRTCSYSLCSKTNMVSLPKSVLPPPYSFRLYLAPFFTVPEVRTEGGECDFVFPLRVPLLMTTHLLSEKQVSILGTGSKQWYITTHLSCFPGSWSWIRQRSAALISSSFFKISFCNPEVQSFATDWFKFWKIREREKVLNFKQII